MLKLQHNNHQSLTTTDAPVNIGLVCMPAFFSKGGLRPDQLYGFFWTFNLPTQHQEQWHKKKAVHMAFSKENQCCYMKSTQESSYIHSINNANDDVGRFYRQAVSVRRQILGPLFFNCDGFPKCRRNITGILQILHRVEAGGQAALWLKVKISLLFLHRPDVHSLQVPTLEISLNKSVLLWQLLLFTCARPGLFRFCLIERWLAGHIDLSPSSITATSRYPRFFFPPPLLLVSLSRATAMMDITVGMFFISLGAGNGLGPPPHSGIETKVKIKNVLGAKLQQARTWATDRLGAAWSLPYIREGWPLGRKMFSQPLGGKCFSALKSAALGCFIAHQNAVKGCGGEIQSGERTVLSIWVLNMLLKRAPVDNKSFRQQRELSVQLTEPARFVMELEFQPWIFDLFIKVLRGTVYCSPGNRSSLATPMLTSMQFNTIIQI